MGIRLFVAALVTTISAALVPATAVAASPADQAQPATASDQISGKRPSCDRANRGRTSVLASGQAREVQYVHQAKVRKWSKRGKHRVVLHRRSPLISGIRKLDDVSVPGQKKLWSLLGRNVLRPVGDREAVTPYRREVLRWHTGRGKHVYLRTDVANFMPVEQFTCTRIVKWRKNRTDEKAGERGTDNARQQGRQHDRKREPRRERVVRYRWRLTDAGRVQSFNGSVTTLVVACKQAPLNPFFAHVKRKYC